MFGSSLTEPEKKVRVDPSGVLATFRFLVASSRVVQASLNGHQRAADVFLSTSISSLPQFGDGELAELHEGVALCNT